MGIAKIINSTEKKNYFSQNTVEIEANPRGVSLEEIMAVEEKSWPEEIRATKEKFEKRLELFPEGFVVAYLNGKMVGVATSEIINYNPNKPPTSWYKITDNGWIEKTHNPKGNAMYIVSIGTCVRDKGIGSDMLKELTDIAKKLGLKYVVVGSRVPYFHKYANKLKIDEYILLNIDPDIKFYSKNRFKINKVIKDYMFDDAESMGYGVTMHKLLTE